MRQPELVAAGTRGRTGGALAEGRTLAVLLAVLEPSWGPGVGGGSQAATARARPSQWQPPPPALTKRRPGF
ncbi:MAG: hypothetical protein AMXMBFR56_18290 [Polyangiaceae bacterium]